MAAKGCLTGQALRESPPRRRDPNTLQFSDAGPHVTSRVDWSTYYFHFAVALQDFFKSLYLTSEKTGYTVEQISISYAT